MAVYYAVSGRVIVKLIDLHADTISSLYYDPLNWQVEQEFLLEQPVASLDKNLLHIDLDKLRQANSLAQFFVLWLNLKNCDKYRISPWQLFMKQYNLLREQITKYDEQINLVNNLATLFAASKSNKLAAFACVEEGGFIENEAQLYTAKELGISYITLVWNYETHIGVPAAVDQSRGLKEFGFKMVELMQQIGIMVDVSHLSDQGVHDVLKIATKPILATHSNARALCNHRRNLPDELITGIANNGGVIGVNCVPYFLSEHDETIRISQMVAHIRHIYNLSGEDVLAIGNDFDGFHATTPELDDIRNITDMPKLIAGLRDAGFSERQIEKIFYGNILRVIESNLG
ncbi:MAG: membrane dipeptidase [Proteobacteria bacterium]|nr:MAG: membrane dipeptidase [Pseudomonadota bacterium]